MTAGIFAALIVLNVITTAYLYFFPGHSRALNFLLWGIALLMLALGCVTSWVRGI